MTDSEPDAATQDDLIAYIDGAAAWDIAESIRRDPTLSTLANAYAHVQRELQRRLYRFNCPSPQRLAEYEMGLLPLVEAAQITAHVIDCPLCSTELQITRAFVMRDVGAS